MNCVDKFAHISIVSVDILIIDMRDQTFDHRPATDTALFHSTIVMSGDGGQNSNSSPETDYVLTQGKSKILAAKSINQ